MVEHTNPIKRLLNILSIVFDYGNSNVSPSSSASIAWMEALEFSGHESLEDLLCDLIADIGEYERFVRRDSRINEVIHLKQIGKVKSGLLNVSSGNWEGFLRAFNEGLLDALQLMAENISINGGEEVISEEDLVSLRAEVEKLIDRVDKSNLEDEFKQVLLDGLEVLRQSIVDYRRFGAERIRQAFDRNIASFYRYREEFKKAYETEGEGKEVISHLLEVLKKVDAIVSMGLKLRQLAEPATQFLMLGVGG